MTLILAALAVLAATGLAAAALGKRPRLAAAAGAGGAIAGSCLGIVPAARAALGGPAESLRLTWSVPHGAFHVEVDALSGFFLIPVFALSALAAVYGASYLQAWKGKKPLGPQWLFFNLLTASMALVLIARNGVLFLVAWEVMAIASFFLVTFEDEKESVREAGRTYLIATHLGTAFLLVLFVLLGQGSGSLDFDAFRGGTGQNGGTTSAAPGAGLLFLLALAGFGTKAGLVPFHVWLPEAHPAAPSHVSALLSAVMVKTGIYGIVRTLTFLGPPPAWWGWLLAGAGLASAVLGVLLALAQRDLKRLLAYSTVENVGIIAVGLGIGVIGLASGIAAAAVLGFGGALLHVLNHGLFKGLLFLAAGSVVHGTGTRDIEALGGLSRRMRWTGNLFLLGAAAASALPPLSGFASEVLIYLGAFHGAMAGGSPALPCLVAIAGLALAGGLAAACFTRAAGIVFLGEPRSAEAAGAHESGPAMAGAMAVLGLGVAATGLLAPLLLEAMGPVIAAAAGLAPDAVRASLPQGTGPLSVATAAGAGFIGLVLALAGLRAAILSGRRVEKAVTWDCGYARPSTRMQYTGSSYAQPLADLFRAFLRPRREAAGPAGAFPDDASFSTATPDALKEDVYRPAFALAGRAFARLRWLQHGRVQIYVLYIALTLLVLLIWKLG
jgi:formate hydrogenlyase subunit 3/multisubunit Na+/H+ antiporter MnhD subunit